MSEFELGLLRQRAQEACRQKALRGDVMTRVPVGFVRKGDTGIEMVPDRQVQQATLDFFARLWGSSSLRQVLLWHHQEKMLFPVSRMRDGCEAIEWRLPNYQQLLRMVKNSTYAGALAWGRSGARSKVVEGRSRKAEGHRLEIDHWQVLLKDHHPGSHYTTKLKRISGLRTRREARLSRVRSRPGVRVLMRPHNTCYLSPCECDVAAREVLHHAARLLLY